MGDTRDNENDIESLVIDEVTELLDQLDELGAVGKSVGSDDEYASRSDYEFPY